MKHVKTGGFTQPELYFFKYSFDLGDNNSAVSPSSALFPFFPLPTTDKLPLSKMLIWTMSNSKKWA